MASAAGVASSVQGRPLMHGQAAAPRAETTSSRHLRAARPLSIPKNKAGRAGRLAAYSSTSTSASLCSRSRRAHSARAPRWPWSTRGYAPCRHRCARVPRDPVPEAAARRLEVGRRKIRARLTSPIRESGISRMDPVPLRMTLVPATGRLALAR
ncbi:hypothetical protein C2845_PM01G09570 [Panicum miliaceum]|uniref:Uncharacterized protein n=1 Tax=Panicum miliaceum TaxID=4540 RepID=A0A3L6TSM3_PANMI|nr:hypothetical protein C2845_PM01G09570 [Panicum miliaceum]